MGSYISEHWNGQHSLTRSLGLNTIAFNIFTVFVFSYLTDWIQLYWTIPEPALLLALVLFWSTVLCWQTVGAFRSATRHIKNYGSVTSYYVVLAVILSSVIFTFASVATQYGAKIDYVQQGVDEYRAPEPTFDLSVDQLNQLTLSGDIGYGATEKLTSLLEQNTKSNLLILNSDGGLIIEARGLANVIKEHKLNTRVSKRCYSACTIAFIAGHKRSLAINAQLGFHQYNLDSAPLPWIEPLKEQSKDLRYFDEKNVPAWFMKKAYSTPHSSIWTPSKDILFSAGVITTKSETLEQVDQ